MCKAENEFQLVNVSDDRVSIQKEFFERTFVEKKDDNANVSGLNLRLKAVLLIHLSAEEPRFLPSLEYLEKVLGANKSSISKCLCLLEDSKFIFRVIDDGQIIIRGCSDEEQSEINKFYRNLISEERRKKRFKNCFILNRNYGLNEKQIEEKNNQDINDIIATIKSKNPNVTESDINKMYDQLKEIFIINN